MLVRKVLQIYKDEGLLSVIRRAFAYIFHNVLSYETYYLTKLPVQYAQAKQKRQVDFADEITGKWIESNKQADEVAKEFEDFRPYAKNARRILDAGGIAACIYVGKELANYSWKAINETAMKTMSHMPTYVDFKNKEFYAGYEYTVPKYRRTGLRYYKLCFEYSILQEMGMEIERSAIRTNNYAALKANSDRPERLGYARGRSTRFMGLRFWKEIPMNVPIHEIAEKIDSK